MAKQDVTVELHYSGVWNDVTGDLSDRDDIKITRGYAGESRQTTPSTATLTFDNRDGTYNPGNGNSPLYGLVGRNTPIRITLDSTDVRFYGEVSSWKPRRAIKGDAYTEVEASGVLRRLGQGNDPLLAPSRRVIPATSPVAYWPLEDGRSSTQAASGLAGGAPMAVTGDVTFGQADTPGGSAASVDLSGGGTLTGPVSTTGASTDSWRVEFGVNFGAIELPFSVGSAFIDLASGDYFELYATHVDDGMYIQFPLTSGGLGFMYMDVDAGDGEWHHIRVDATTATGGTETRIEVYLDGVLVEDTVNAIGFSPVSQIRLVEAPGLAQVAVWSPWDTGLLVDTVDASTGYAGETAADRVGRLCDEESVADTLVGVAADSQPMGPQTALTLLDLLAECEATDGGMLYESRDALGLAYRTRHDLYNQAVALELDYDAGQLAPPLDPAVDDKATRNDVTVKRRDGSSARRVRETGPLSVQAPPDGVGRVKTQADVNTDVDTDLVHHAGWHLHLGTVDETRWPKVTVDLDAAPALAASASAVDVGDVITVDNLDPGQVQLLVLGYTETIGNHRRKITYNCAPEAPWEVWQLDTGGSTLTKAAGAAVTTLKLDTSAGPAWSTVDEPYHLQIDGEAMTVTAMVTDTITFVAAGTVAHAVNASVVPGLPAGLAEGDLMLIWAAIRNAGTGSPDVPAGWTVLAEGSATPGFASCPRLFGKYAGPAEVAPTVTFTGGVANADTSAQMCAFRGASLQLDDGAYQAASPSPQGRSNSSAQDIAYPALSVRRAGCVVIYAGWKQDDWTSVAAIAGATEIGEPDTTTGDDQGIVWDYVIQTTAANIAAGSFVVTGGASAVSRSAVAALRPTQTATVTRAVNGVSKALTVGEAANGWRLGVIAL